MHLLIGVELRHITFYLIRTLRDIFIKPDNKKSLMSRTKSYDDGCGEKFRCRIKVNESVCVRDMYHYNTIYGLLTSNITSF